MSPIQILDPTGVLPEVAAAKTHKLDTLTGKKIGFRVDWPNYDHFCNRVDEIVRSKFEVSDIVHYHPEKRSTSAAAATDKEMKDFASKVDAAVVGLAA